jgi:integrase
LQYAKVYYRKNGQPTSSLIRVRVAIKLLKQLYGREPIASFGPLKLRALQQNMVLAKKARRYVNHVTQQVKRIFKWGVSMELVPAVIFQALATVPSLPKGRSEAVEPPPVRPVSDEDVRKTLPYLPQIVADMVVFQRLTGCRPGEVCIVRPCDLDTSGDVWVYTPQFS